MAFRAKIIIKLIGLVVLVGCSSGAKKREDRVQLMNRLASQSLADNRPVDAVRAYREALSLQPKNVEIMNNLGIAYAAMGDAAQAEKQFRDILVIQKEYKPAMMNLGLLLGDQNNFVVAQELLEQAANDPDFVDRPKAILGLARLATRRDQALRAERFYSQLLMMDAQHCQGNAELGRLLHQSNRSRMAIPYLEKATQGLCFSQRDSHLRLAQALAEVGDTGKAVTIWGNIKKSFPGTEEAAVAATQLSKRGN